MEPKLIRVSFSIIGDLTSFLKSNQQLIKNLLPGYEIESKIDNLEDGTTVKSLRFTKQGVSILFAPARVDFVFSLARPDTPISTCLAPACDFYKNLELNAPEFFGNRIAIVASCFIENQQNKAIEEFTKKMYLKQGFGTCNELSFKINTPINSFEPLNSVLNVDMGTASNNKTGEKIPVLLASIDVNTLAANKAPRFSAANSKPLFTELLKYVETKFNELKKY